MSGQHNFKNGQLGSAEGLQARSGVRSQWPFTKSPIQSSIGSRLHSQAEVYRQQRERLVLQHHMEQELKLREEASFRPHLVAADRSRATRHGKHEDRLIQQGRAKEESLLKKRRERDQLVLKECQNFRPKINKNSERIEGQKIANLCQQNAIRESEEKARRDMEKLASRKQSPGAENVSLESIEEEESSASRVFKYDRFTDLYVQALKQRLNQEKLMALNFDQECTFRPKLHRRPPSLGRAKSEQRLKGYEANRESLELDKQNSTAQNEQEPGQGRRLVPGRSLEACMQEEAPSVWERMQVRIHEFRKQREMRENPERFNLVPTHDARTGQPLFQPKLVSDTNQNHQSAPHSARDNKWEALYQNAQVRERKKQKMVEEQIEHERQRALNRSQYQSIDKSARIFEQKLRSKLKEIFDLFDANGNGKLSADEINLDFVSAEILEIFKPLLVELETFNEELDKDEFVESAVALLATLDI